MIDAATSLPLLSREEIAFFWSILPAIQCRYKPNKFDNTWHCDLRAIGRDCDLDELKKKVVRKPFQETSETKKRRDEINKILKELGL